MTLGRMMTLLVVITQEQNFYLLLTCLHVSEELEAVKNENKYSRANSTIFTSESVCCCNKSNV